MVSETTKEHINLPSTTARTEIYIAIGLQRRYFRSLRNPLIVLKGSDSH